MKNYHTHTSRCRHAYGKDRDYVIAAIKTGITELGFSDHAPMIFPTDYYSTFRMFISDTADYICSIKRLKKEYEDKIKIYIGFELEYYPDLFEQTLDFLNQFDYDYLILGQHFVGNEFEESSHYSGAPTNDVRYLEGYINQALEGLKTGKFKYIAHPDLIKFIGSDEIYKEKMTYFCKEIKELGYPVEFNMLGFAQNRNYPDKRFWEVVSKVGNDVIIGLDAHSPDAFKNKKLLANAKKYLKDLNIDPIDHIEI